MVVVLLLAFTAIVSSRRHPQYYNYHDELNYYDEFDGELEESREMMRYRRSERAAAPL